MSELTPTETTQAGLIPASRQEIVPERRVGCPCQSCGQSPIHVQSDKAENLPEDVAISIHFAPTPRLPRKVHNDHGMKFNTVEIEGTPGSVLNIRKGDQVFAAELAQFHTHFGSEHKIDGKRYDGELHFVFKSPEGHVAVAAVMVQAGGEKNKELEKILETMGLPEPEKKGLLQRATGFLKRMFGKKEVPQEKPQEAQPIMPVNFKHLVSPSADIFYTIGSLTAPDNTGDFREGVQWLIFKEPIQATQEQIDRFTQAIGKENNRSLFPVGNRPVFKGQVQSVVADRVILPKGTWTKDVLAASPEWRGTIMQQQLTHPTTRER